MTTSTSTSSNVVVPREEHPKVTPHGPIEKVLEDIFVVTGSVAMPFMGCCECRFSRNMQIVRQNDGNLVLINTVRLTDETLQELDELGTVTHIIRIAGFHGMDDPFYKQRYPHATVWTIDENITYFSGFDPQTTQYFVSDKYLLPVNGTSEFPIQDCELIVIDSKKHPRDGILCLKRRPEGTVFVTGDSLQNFVDCKDGGFNLLGSWMMKRMGFIHPYQIGPAWRKVQQVKKSDMMPLLEYKFDHVLPGHGRPVLGQAWKKYQPSIEAMEE